MRANFNDYTPTDTSYARYGNITNTAPSQQARVIQNCYIDKKELELRQTRRKMDFNGKTYYAPWKAFSADTENFSILTNELCFKRVTPDAFNGNASRRQRRSYKPENELEPEDGYPLVFSSFNDIGFAHANTDIQTFLPNDEDKKAHLRKQFQLVGVAQTTKDIAMGGLDYENKRIDIPVQIGGIAELHNTGKEDIFAGDWIIWDVRGVHADDAPESSYHPQSNMKAEGTTRTKVLPVIRPLRSEDFISTESIRSYFPIKYITDYTNNQERVKELITENIAGVQPSSLSAFSPSTRQFARSLVRFVYAISKIDNAIQAKVFAPGLGALPLDDLVRDIKDTVATTTDDQRMIRSVAILSLLFKLDSTGYGDAGSVDQYVMKNGVKDLIINMYRPMEDVLSRVVGKAIRSFSPGNAGDVLLGAPYFV